MISIWIDSSDNFKMAWPSSYRSPLRIIEWNFMSWVAAGQDLSASVGLLSINCWSAPLTTSRSFSHDSTHTGHVDDNLNIGIIDLYGGAISLRFAYPHNDIYATGRFKDKPLPREHEDMRP